MVNYSCVTESKLSELESRIGDMCLQMDVQITETDRQRPIAIGSLITSDAAYSTFIRCSCAKMSEPIVNQFVV